MLETIRASAPISRAEISRRAGISKPTVSLALQSLLEAGLVREAAHDPGGPPRGAVFFEPVPEAALVPGWTSAHASSAARSCDLPARCAPARTSRSSARRARRARHDRRLRDALVTTTGFDAARIDGAVVGVPGVVDAGYRPHRPGDQRAGSGGRRLRAGAARAASRFPVALENDVDLAAVGEQWRGVARGVDDFAFLSVGIGMGAGLRCAATCTGAITAPRVRSTSRSSGWGEDVDPCAGAIRVRGAPRRGRLAHDELAPPFDARAIFAAARNGPSDEWSWRRAARRIALHLVAISAVADYRPRRARWRHRLERRPAALARARCWQGGSHSASGRDLELGGSWSPGALAVGLERGTRDVFVNRVRIPVETAS